MSEELFLKFLSGYNFILKYLLKCSLVIFIPLLGFFKDNHYFFGGMAVLGFLFCKR